MASSAEQNSSAPIESAGEVGLEEVPHPSANEAQKMASPLPWAKEDQKASSPHPWAEDDILESSEDEKVSSEGCKKCTSSIPPVRGHGAPQV